MTTVPPQNAPFSVVLGTLLNGTQVAVRVPAYGCTRGDFIRALEASTGQVNVFWLVLRGSMVLARAADKYLEHSDQIDEMPTEGLTFLKHQHKLTRQGYPISRFDARLAERNAEYHAIFLADWASYRRDHGYRDFPDAEEDRVLSKDFALILVELFGHALLHIPNFSDDQEVVERAVRNDGEALEHASDSLRDNESIVTEAVRQNGAALRFASSRLKDNEAIVTEAVRTRGEALRFGSRIRTHSGVALLFASSRLRDNEAIVTEAVRTHGGALGYASDRLKDNEAIVMEAVRQNSWALDYASDRLKLSEAIGTEVVRQHSWVLDFASDRLQHNQKRRRVDR